MPDGQSANTPAWCDSGQWLKDEAAFAELPVGDEEFARDEPASTPQGDVQVQHPWAPTAPTAAAEIAFDDLQASEHNPRLEAAFNQCDSVGEVAPGIAMRGVEDDLRGVKQSELLVQPGDRRLDDARGAPVAAVRSVRADRDGVEVGH